MGRPVISVIGCGYLGATHAACMAELGFDVVGLDTDEDKVKRLGEADLPFYEPGLPELLAKQVQAGRLRFTTDAADASRAADVHFLCVGTPQKRGGYAADLTYLDAAVEAVLPHLDETDVLVGKSTVPAGTARGLRARMDEAGLASTTLAWNPEFLREGYAVEDTLRPDRLVVGAEDEAAERAMREVYAQLLDAGVPLVVTDFPTAELVKVSANAFLATKISFINAMAEVCEAVGGDVTMLSRALSYDERIGGKFLQAGIGFGGGCLPKDIRAFMARAGELGVDQALSFLKEVDAINLRRREHVVHLAREMVGGSFGGTRIAVLGAAFKPNSDDIRDSPALDVAAQCQVRGAAVTLYDPQAMHNARREFPTLGYRDSVTDAVRGADLVLHLTEWQEFRDLDPGALGELVTERRVIDGRNALDVDAFRAAGWTFRGLGRP